MVDSVNKDYLQQMTLNKFALRVNTQENMPIQSMLILKIQIIKIKNYQTIHG